MGTSVARNPQLDLRKPKPDEKRVETFEEAARRLDCDDERAVRGTAQEDREGDAATEKLRPEALSALS